MKHFAMLFHELDRSTRTNEKVAAMVRYFRGSPPADSAWAVRLLSGERLKGVAKSSVFHAAALSASGLPDWLLAECHEACGDLSEAVALVVPEGLATTDVSLAEVMQEWIQPLAVMSDLAAEKHLLSVWSRLPADQRLVFNKLVRGGFRVGVSRGLVVRALAEVSGIEQGIMVHRMSGGVQPTAAAFARLTARVGDAEARRSEDAAQPYPFYLASPLGQSAGTLGEIGDWVVEYKWDGIRAQIIRRGNDVLIWSRGEELITSQFPELAAMARGLPDGTVLDGELLAWRRAGGGRALPFNALQARLNRKSVQPGLFDTETVVFMAFDILEQGGADVRSLPQADRRTRLEAVLTPIMPNVESLRLSPLLAPDDWEHAARLRSGARAAVEAEGLMLKHREARYEVGRTLVHRVEGDGRSPGGWWKWKVDPFTVDAVLIYAQAGSGKRAGLFTDYTLGVWSGDRGRGELTPFAKAYSGLTNEEILEVDRFIRNNTLGRKGPVRLVRPLLVFELAFEGIARSTRHRSGVAVRFPRVTRWRTDKSAADADTLAILIQLVEQFAR